MTKPELIKALALQSQLSLRDADEVFSLLIDTMAAAMQRNERIEVRGFGSFMVNERKAHMARNPKTGEDVQVPHKRVPSFKPGKDLRESVAKAGA